MKFQVMMKDPDTLHDAVREAASKSVKDIGLNDREQSLIAEAREETFREIAGRWFEDGEYLTVEIDTDAKTCVVVAK